MKADGSRLIPRKHTETLVLLTVLVNLNKLLSYHLEERRVPQVVRLQYFGNRL